MSDSNDLGTDHASQLEQICYDLPKSKPDNLDHVLPYLTEVTETLRAGHAQTVSAADSNIEMIPPAEYVGLLRLLGWALYEAAISATDRVDTAYISRGGQSEKKSTHAAGEITEVANLARALPWPHFALRSLGAIRSEALMYSKRDTDDGYRKAWTAHQQADDLLRRRTDEILSGYLSDTEHYIDLKRDVAEVSEQLELSKTGTACRQAEYILCRWNEQTDFEDDEQSDAIAMLVHGLQLGISSGERAITLAQDVHDNHGGIPKKRDYKKLLGPTSKQNPGIMTARAYLLLIPMCPLMRRYEKYHPDDKSWDDYAHELALGFKTAYSHIERPYSTHIDGDISFITRHIRSIAQLRLNFGLIFPDEQLPTLVDDISFPREPTLDWRNIEELSRWLASREDDANVIGSAIMPDYISGIDAIRGEKESDSKYRAWRREWPHLDRSYDEPRRAENVAAALRVQ